MDVVKCGVKEKERGQIWKWQGALVGVWKVANADKPEGMTLQDRGSYS